MNEPKLVRADKSLPTSDEYAAFEDTRAERAAKHLDILARQNNTVLLLNERAGVGDGTPRSVAVFYRWVAVEGSDIAVLEHTYPDKDGREILAVGRNVYGNFYIYTMVGIFPVTDMTRPFKVVEGALVAEVNKFVIAIPPFPRGMSPVGAYHRNGTLTLTVEMPSWRL